MASDEEEMDVTDKGDIPTNDPNRRLRLRRHAELLDQLPRYRACMKQCIFPYYAVGHDRGLSSLSGILVWSGQGAAEDVRLEQNTGEVSSTDKEDTDTDEGDGENHDNDRNVSGLKRDEREDQTIKLNQLSKEERANLSFFYGGCGDCRHVYLTLYDLGLQFEEAREGDALVGNRVHFLLNDTSPSILARCAVLLVALHDLSQFPAQDIRERRSEEVIVIYAFLHFMLVSPVVPGYVNDKFCSIVRRLLESPRLHSLFHLSQSTLCRVRTVLERWLSDAEDTDQNTLREKAEDFSQGFWKNERDHLYKWYGISKEQQSMHQADVDRHIDNHYLSFPGDDDDDDDDIDDEIDDVDDVDDDIEDVHDDIDDDKDGGGDDDGGDDETDDVDDETDEVDDDVDDDDGDEQLHGLCALKKRITLNACLVKTVPWLSRLVQPADLLFAVVHEVLPPPIPLLSLHSLEMRRYYHMTHDDVELTTNGIFVGVANQILKLSQGDIYNASAVFDDFAPNPTGQEHLESPEQIEENEGEDFVAPLHWCIFQVLSRLYSGKVVNMPPGHKFTLFGLSCSIWEKAALAVKQLSSEPESSLGFEFTLGDMSTVARRITLSAEERATQNLPHRFLRAFVSNVPDYTGLLYPLVDIASSLVQSNKAFLRCNVQRSVEKWADCRRWAESRLVFEDADYTGAIFGVCILLGSHLRRFVWWGKDGTRMPIEQPAELGEGTLCTLLHRVFIGVAFPPSQSLNSPNAHIPETLVVFMELILTLVERRTDRCWIRDAIEAMLALQANIFNPRPPEMEEHLPERKTAPFRPFLLELRTLLALYQPILNLGIAPECGVPRCESISPRSLTWSRELIVAMPDHGDGEERTQRKVRALYLSAGMIIFPDQYLGKRPRELALLKGTQAPAHFLSVVSWCLSTRTARFYLPDQDYERMKSEAMNVVMYSTVTYDTVTEPIKLQ